MVGTKPITKSDTILITGGTSGIGEALCTLLQPHCKKIIIIGRRQSNLDAISAKFDNVEGIQFDISKLNLIDEFVEEMIEKGVNYVILNAGMQRMHDFTKPESVDISEFENEMSTNYFSPVRFTKSFLTAFNANSTPATICYVTSGLAFFPLPRSPAYSSTKSALRSFILALRRQLNSTSSNTIKIIEIIPPAVETELHDIKHQPLLGMSNVPQAVPLKDYSEDLVLHLLQGEIDEIGFGTSKISLEKVGGWQREMVGRMPVLF